MFLFRVFYPKGESAIIDRIDSEEKVNYLEKVMNDAVPQSVFSLFRAFVNKDYDSAIDILSILSDEDIEKHRLIHFLIEKIVKKGNAFYIEAIYAHASRLKKAHKYHVAKILYAIIYDVCKEWHFSYFLKHAHTYYA